MFGTNPLSKPLESDGQWLEVQSIFSTIQGEGPFAGQPAIFLRMAGCNLRCFFCDTDFESRRSTMSLGMIRNEIHRVSAGSRPTLVVVTGGEPLLQNVVPLVDMLAKEGYHVQFETAGTVWPDNLEPYLLKGQIFDKPVASIVCSPKAGKVHELIAHYCHNWKYLIRYGEVSDTDGLPIKSTQIPGKDQPLFRPPRKTDTVWLQPCEEYVVDYKPKAIKLVELGSEGILADQEVTSSVRDEVRSRRNVRLCAELAMKFNYRISLQLHKLLQLP